MKPGLPSILGNSVFRRPGARVFPLLAVLLLLAAGWARADGGVPIARHTVEGWDLTVFASPVPLRAGPVDVSVLVQDAKTGSAVLDASVFVGWQSDGPPGNSDWLPLCCSMDTLQGKIPALRTHSQNKLLYGAWIPVRTEGPSRLTVDVATPGRSAALTIEIDARPPRAPLAAYWPLLAFPPAAAGVFALHRSLIRRRVDS